jgi:hypothetical protein
MKTINVREFKDLTPAQQEKARDACVNSEVEFHLDMLNSDLEKGEINEDEFWKEIGCSKSYGESTCWFVPSVYYEHHKELVDEAIKADLEAAVFNESGTRIFGVK